MRQFILAFALLLPTAAWAHHPASLPGAATPSTHDHAKPCDRDKGGKDGKPCDKGGKPCDGDCDDRKDGKPCDKGGKPCDKSGKPCDGDCDDRKDGKPCDKDAKPCDKSDKPCDGDCDDRKDGKPCDKSGKPCDGDCDDRKDGKPCDEGGKPCDRGCDDGKPCEGGCERGRPHHGGPLGQGGMGFRWGHRPPGAPYVRPTALLQTVVAPLVGSQAQLARGDRAERAGFGLQTVRVGMEGELGRGVRFVANTDLSLLATQPVREFYFGIKPWRSGELIVGSARIPFSRSALVLTGDQGLAVRPLAVLAMAPFQQVGVTLTGHYPNLLGLRWAAGAYNAFERNTNTFDGVVINAGLRGNRFGGISLAGRLELEPMGPLGPGTGDFSHGPLRFGLAGGGYWNDGGSVTSWGTSTDLLLKVRGVHLLAEFLQDHGGPRTQPETPAFLPAALTRRAFIGEAGYTLWYLSGAARVEWIDPNVDLADDRDELVLSGALSWQARLNSVRVTLQYDHRQERHLSSDQQVKNDVLFAQLQLRL